MAEILLAASGVKPSWKYASGYAVDHVIYRYGLNPGNYEDLFGAKDVRINSLGTRGPEPQSPVYLALGDSCTFGVGLLEADTYPFMLGLKSEQVINAGVPGYNSFQGMKWLIHSQILEQKPKLITVYFGWNDHWRAFLTERQFSYIRQAANFLRSATILLRLQDTLYSQDEKAKKLRFFPQVPISEYRENLRLIIKMGQSINSTVLLITAPSNDRHITESPWFKSNSLNESSWFKSRSLDEYYSHMEYVEATRKVAEEMGTPIIDLHLELEKRSGSDWYEYFLDFAHLNAKGNQVLAEMLQPYVARIPNN